MTEQFNLPQNPRNIIEMNDNDFLLLVNKYKELNPNSRSVNLFNPEEYMIYDNDMKRRLRSIMAPGLMSADSKIGVYVRNPEDYNRFPLLLRIIQDYHSVNLSGTTYESDWEVSEGESFDLKNLDSRLNDVSMRIRIAGIPKNFNLPAEMTKDERLDFEKRMIEIFKTLDGRYYSLTPDSEYFIDDKSYRDFINNHIAFKPMIEDPHLRVSDLAKDWPYGRGFYIKEIENTDFKFIVWVGEEDLLRIMCMGNGSDLAIVFNQLKSFIDLLKERGLELVENSIIGTPASCPSNIGTSMRMSILFDAGNLTKDQMKDFCMDLGLQVR